MKREVPQDAILAFNDSWCAQCYTEKRVLNEFAQKNRDQKLLVNVDAEENPEMFEKYGVKHTPTTIFVKDGKVVEEFRRYMDLDQLSQAAKYYF